MGKFSGIAGLLPLPQGGSDRTLGEARSKLREKIEAGEGVTCPCCAGHAEAYARGINTTMVKMLRIVARPGGATAKEVIAQLPQGGGGDLGKFTLWGMIEKTKSGRWVVTSKGIDFLHGRISVPHKAVVYQGNLIGFDHSRLIFVHDVDEEFSLDEARGDNVTSANIDPKKAA